jgi:CheY-like chemotaxis protein
MKPIRCHYLLEHIRRSTDLPVPSSSESPASVTPANPAPARLLNILLAEDNLINQQVAARRLQKLGHTVEIANNGAEAVAALKARSYDLILMDVQMPEMDGFEATAAIRSMTGEKRRIPIIAMTANALPSDCERCLAAGMDDYIAKPVHQRTLVELIEKWGAIGYASAHPQPVAAVEFAHTDVDLLDLDGIREMIEVLGLDAYRDLTEQFFDSHGAAAGAFRDAAASGDDKHLGRLAHSLKGAASNLGLAVLAEQAAALQPAVDEEHGESLDDGVGLTERISSLEAMVEASKQQLLALLDRVPAEWEGAAA